jgi:histidinol dehydrogenase
MSKSLTTAGATFLGPYSPVAVGDYAAGPSHVLPTGGTARWASGLSSNSFLRSSSVIEFSQQALANIAPDVQEIAIREGLTAHWNSVKIRSDN